MLKWICCYLFLGVSTLGAIAQSVNESRMILSSTMVGIGWSDLLDTYLSPLDYKGIGISVHHERLQAARRGKGDRVNQLMVRGSYTNTYSFSKNGAMVAGMASAGWGTMWRWQALSTLTLSGGPYGNFETGVTYNLRNGNNPASAILNVQAGGTGMANYQFRIGRQPFIASYQAWVPLAGGFFMPPYGASYYEIFVLGNRKNIFHFGSLHNRFDLDNTLMIDVPFRVSRLRVGYYSMIRNAHVNGIKARHIENAFLIGYSRELLPVKRKRN